MRGAARRSRRSAASPARACAAAAATRVCSISASTSSPSRNRITISATIARSCTKPRPRRRTRAPRARPSPSTKPASTNSAVSDRNERRASPDEQRAAPSAARRRRAARSSKLTGLESRQRVHDGEGLTRRAHHRARASRRPGRTPDGACSGYLVEEDGFHLLLDCGNGVFAKLRRFVDYVDVDAVVISHLHADHFLDLVPFAYALTYAPRQQPVPVGGWPGTDHPAGPELHVPPGARRRVPPRRRRVGQRGPDRERVRDARVRPGRRRSRVGPLRIRFQPVPHFIADATRSRSPPPTAAGASPTAPTTRPTDALVDFARDTDLLMIEATLPRPEREGPRGHLTPARGRRARPQGRRAAGRADPLLRRAGRGLGAREDAETAFGGPVEVAREGAVYDV